MLITADTHISVALDEVPHEVLSAVKQNLEIPNSEKAAAARELVYGWKDMPDKLPLWREENGQLILPRGYMRALGRGLQTMKIPYEVDDRRAVVYRDWESEGALWQPKLWPHQIPAACSMLVNEQGMYQAPPGSGKTVTSLTAIVESKMRSIILVDKTNIARQWAERALEHIGVEIGIIGDGEWLEKDITVATFQTLWRRSETLDFQHWWDTWGLILHDECHHSPATTYEHVIQRFPARYRLGVSATPDRFNGTFEVAQAVLGEVFHVTEKPALVDAGILVRPKVLQVPTEFKFRFHPTFSVDRTEQCRLEGCEKNGTRHMHRNNYQALIKAVIECPDRNLLVAKQILLHRGHRCIVLSQRLNHLDALMKSVVSLGWPEDRCFMMTGEQDSEERLRIGRYAYDDEIVIFSTVADEALDVPVLDRIFLPFPTRNAAKLTQQIGRIERRATGKEDALAIDFADNSCSVLRNQAAERRKEVYLKEGWDVSALRAL
jgi:superfamily II DNA or RNA helicase